MESQILESPPTTDAVIDNTTFVDMVTPDTPEQVPEGFHADDRDADESRTHDALAILGRSTRFGTLEITPQSSPITYSRLAGSQEVGVFPKDIFKHNQEFANRLSGFTYFKAAMVFTVQVVATKFHAGLYWLWWDYYRDQVERGPTQWRANAVAHIPAISTQKGVLIDVSNTQTVELKVPFFSQYAAWNLISGECASGSLYLAPYTALSCPTATSKVSLNVWMRFENIKLMLPTNAPLHSTYKPSTQKTRAQLLKELEELESQGIYPRQQVGDEAEAASKTPTAGISGYVAKGATAMGSLSGIPVIGMACRIIGWLGHGASLALALAGWSRPIDLRKNDVFVQRYPGTSHYTDQVMEVDTLAPTLDIGVNNDNRVFPSPLDEMSYEFLYTRESVFHTFRWQSSTGRGSNLATYNLTPFELKLGNLMTPAAWLATQHKFWRGDFVYTFRVAKTAMHSGILRFSTTYGGDARGNWNNALTQVWNLEEDCCFSVKIPFKSVVKFNRIGSDHDSLGTLYVRVDSPLIAPPVVNPYIDVVVSVKMENATFAGPEFGYTAWQPKAQMTRAELEVGDEMPMQQMAPSYLPTVRGVEVSSDTKMAIKDLEADVIGFAVNNLRPLTRIPCLSYYVAHSSSVKLAVSPFYLGDMPNNRFEGRVSFYHEFSAMYRFARGGTRTTFSPPLVNNSIRQVTRVPSVTGAAMPLSIVAGSVLKINPGLNTHTRILNASQRLWHIEQPHMSSKRFRINGLPDDERDDILLESDTANTIWGQCAADDHTYAGFLGIPIQYFRGFDGEKVITPEPAEEWKPLTGVFTYIAPNYN